MASLILASKSQARFHLLQQAGIACEIIPANIDEAAIKFSSQKNDEISSEDLACLLAHKKARMISSNQPGRLVIGADQILNMGGKTFDKPQNISSARSQLIELRGKTHQLISAISCIRDGEVLWKYVDQAQLTMCNFSDDFLDIYLAKAGEDITKSVGGYQLEGPGVQLFNNIEGDYFTILGLPLLPLLGFLRIEGIVPA